MVELLSILILTFALSLVALGLVTMWLERDPGRWQGIIISMLGLLVGVGYAFLASRFSISTFGRLIVRVDLPFLLVTAVNYGIGMLVGVGMSVGLFMWVTGRFKVSQVRHRVLSLALTVFVLAAALIALAIRLSYPSG
jgi:hypothetical protein